MKITFKIPIKTDKDIDKTYKFKTTGKMRRLFLLPFWPMSRKFSKRLLQKYHSTTYTIGIHTNCEKSTKK